MHRYRSKLEPRLKYHGMRKSGADKEGSIVKKNRGFSPGPQGEAKASLPDIENHYQFITFRTQDSVDGYLKKRAQ